MPEDEHSPGLVPNFDVDFSGQEIVVLEGEQLAIVARSDVPFDSNRTFAIIASVGSSHAGGEAWFGFPDWARLPDRVDVVRRGEEQAVAPS